MDRPSPTTWSGTLGKNFPIHQVEEPPQAGTPTQGRITATTLTPLMEIRDPREHTPALDRSQLGHKEAEVILRLEVITIQGPRAHPASTTTTPVIDQDPRIIKDTPQLTPLVTPRSTPSLSPPIKGFQGPHRHYNPHPTQASPAMTVEGPGPGPEADPCREAAKETSVSPPATPPARHEDKEATEVAATAATGGILENLCHTR